jgi:hypothetical protein
MVFTGSAVANRRTKVFRPIRPFPNMSASTGGMP